MAIVGAMAIGLRQKKDRSSFRVPGFPDWKYQIERGEPTQTSGPGEHLFPWDRRYYLYVGNTEWADDLVQGNEHLDPEGTETEESIHRLMWGTGSKGVQGAAYDYYRSLADRHGSPENVYEQDYAASTGPFKLIVYRWGSKHYEAIILAEGEYLARRDSKTLSSAIAWLSKMAKEFDRTNWASLDAEEKLSLPPSQWPKG
jgi:hypothetical protein